MLQPQRAGFGLVGTHVAAAGQRDGQPAAIEAGQGKRGQQVGDTLALGEITQEKNLPHCVFCSLNVPAARLRHAIENHLDPSGRHAHNVHNKTARCFAQHDHAGRQRKNLARGHTQTGREFAIGLRHLSRMQVQHHWHAQSAAAHNHRAFAKHAQALGHVDVNARKATTDASRNDPDERNHQHAQ